MGGIMLPGHFAGGTGGVGSGSAGAAQQAAGLTAAEEPLEIKAEQNPDIRALLDEMKKYRKGLAAGKDVDAINSMMRQRDVLSGMGKEWEATAARQGFGPGSGAGALGLGRLMGSGQRDISSLNAANVSDARRAQLAALTGQGNLEMGQANVTLGQQQFALSTWEAQKQAALAAAQMAMQREEQQRNDLIAALGFFSG